VQEVKNVLNYVFQEITSEDIEYIIMRLFEYTNSLKGFDLRQIFVAFDANGWQKREERYPMTLVSQQEKSYPRNIEDFGAFYLQNMDQLLIEKQKKLEEQPFHQSSYNLETQITKNFYPESQKSKVEMKG